MTVTSNYKIPKLFGKPLLPLLSAWLFTFIGGYASAYAYVVLDGVFANMQTGNIIKCVIFAMEGKEFLYLLYSILSFILGVVTAVVLGRFDRGNIITLTIEMSFIAISCVFAVGGENNKLFVNLLVSFSCALQYEFFRVVGESGFTSVMCTNNMRLAVRNFTSGVIERDKKKSAKEYIFCPLCCFSS